MSWKLQLPRWGIEVFSGDLMGVMEPLADHSGSLHGTYLETTHHVNTVPVVVFGLWRHERIVTACFLKSTLSP